MPSPLAALAAVAPAALEATSTAPAPPLDGATSAFLSALAPVWPALTPWLVVGGVALAMGLATEVVVRELHRTTAPPAGRAPRR